MKLIIIACCKTKKLRGNTSYKSSPLAGYLSSSYFQQLMVARRELASILNLPPGPDLGFQYQFQSLEFMPAYRRYNGIIYKGSDFEKFYPQETPKKVIIISALYGILDASENIRNYELNMDFTLPIRRKVKTWWKNQGLGSIVRALVCKDAFQLVHDLLPKTYRDALRPWPPNCKNGNLIQYDYPGQGSGSIWRRAEDLSKLLKS